MNNLLARLAEPFEPSAITWKPGAVKNNKCMALAYADLRSYMERLDEVCGLEWAVAYEPWGEDRIICRLTLAGVTRSSTGEHNAQDEKNGMGGTVAEAQAFKRAAAMFGLGRFLYEFPAVWVDFDNAASKISKAGQTELDRHYQEWYARNARKPNLLSPAQLIRLNVLGMDCYKTRERWDKERPRLVQHVSKGAISSSKELTSAEADTLIKGLEKELAKAAVANAKVAV